MLLIPLPGTHCFSLLSPPLLSVPLFQLGKLLFNLHFFFDFFFIEVYVDLQYCDYFTPVTAAAPWRLLNTTMCTGPGEPRAAWNQAWQLIGSLSTGLCAPSLQIPLNTVTRRAAEGKGSRRTQVLDPMMSPPVRAKSLHSCPTLCDPMDCSPPGSPVHGILQARILEC